MWLEQNNKLIRTFEFNDFQEAFGFITRVALLSEKMDHHPTWSNTYNSVHIELCTHSANNSITEKDRELARQIDQIAI